MGANASVPRAETNDVNMSHRYYVETSTTGSRQFVKLKRSRSYHHDHHHHRRRHSHHHDDDKVVIQPVAPCESEYYRISKEEWTILKERDRILTDNNKILTNDNNDLRASLADAQAEAHRLGHVVVPDLQCQIATLVADNAGLRRSLDAATEHAEKHHREADRLQGKVDRLEKEAKDARDEIADLRCRLKALTKQLDGNCNRRLAEMAKELDYWRDQARSWKCRFEDKLEFRTQRVGTYDDILKRRCYV